MQGTKDDEGNLETGLNNRRETIRLRLIEIMDQRGISNKALSELLKVKPSSVSNWRNGVNSIDIEKLWEFCKHYNVPLAYMLGDQQQTEDTRLNAIIEAYSQMSEESRNTLKTVALSLAQHD